MVSRLRERKHARRLKKDDETSAREAAVHCSGRQQGAASSLRRNSSIEMFFQSIQSWSPYQPHRPVEPRVNPPPTSAPLRGSQSHLDLMAMAHMFGDSEDAAVST